jgi:hypothetical protein
MVARATSERRLRLVLIPFGVSRSKFHHSFSDSIRHRGPCDAQGRAAQKREC